MTLIYLQIEKKGLPFSKHFEWPINQFPWKIDKNSFFQINQCVDYCVLSYLYARKQSY